MDGDANFVPHFEYHVIRVAECDPGQRAFHIQVHQPIEDHVVGMIRHHAIGLRPDMRWIGNGLAGFPDVAYGIPVGIALAASQRPF